MVTNGYNGLRKNLSQYWLTLVMMVRRNEEGGGEK